MKILKTASGKKTVKISKKEWQSIGKKAGWMKVSQFDHKNPNNYATGEIPYTDDEYGEVSNIMKKELAGYSSDDAMDEPKRGLYKKIENDLLMGVFDTVKGRMKHGKYIEFESKLKELATWIANNLK